MKILYKTALRLETFFTFIDRLKVRYQASLDQIKQLAPSLLAKALLGELVSKDPHDEPKVVL